MSSIEKLSIRGIRSFSPNHEEIIEFYHPLTVILGDNGSGKTTIIECLKISCTGSLPPGARSGQSFVHDPRIAGTNEVKASVRLRFRNRAGKPMVVHRTFQLLQQKTNTKFKAMDGVIRVKNELGENVSMSHKCAELDRHIPEMLGVSKAILDSVIFCHQEESNWPLLEGAELKKRFDNIFESARYTKALEAIRKLKKARGDSAKDFKRDLDVLNVKLTNAEEIRHKIEIAEEKLRGVTEEAAELDSNVEKAEETREEMEQLLAEIKAEHAKLERFQYDAAQKEEDIARASQKLEQRMSDTDEELQTLLSNYDAIIADQHHAFKVLKDQESQLLEEEKSAQDKYAQLCMDKGIVEANITNQQSLVTELLDLAAKAGTKYQFHSQPLSSQDDDIKSFLSKFQHFVSEKSTALAQVEAQNRQGEDRLNEAISELKAKLHHTTEQLKVKQRDRGVLNSEKRKNAARLKELSSKGIPTARDVAEAEKLVEEAQKSLETFKTEHNFLSLKNDMQDINKRIHDVSFEIRRDDGTIGMLRKNEHDYIALEGRRREVREKEEGLQVKLADIATEYRALFDGDTPTDEATLQTSVDRLDELTLSRKTLLNEKKKLLAAAEQTLQENLASSKHVEKNLAALRLEKNELECGPICELKKLVEEISPGEELRNAEEVLRKTEKAYFAAKDKTMRCKNTVTFLGIFKEKGIKDKCCPLCIRGLSSAEEELFVKTINEKTDDKKVKDKIKKAELAEETAFRRWKEVESDMPSWRKWKRMEDQITEKSNELDALYAAKRGLQADMNEKRSQVEKAEVRTNDVGEARRYLATLTTVVQDLWRMRKKIASDEERLRSIDADMLGADAPTLAQVQAARDEKQARLQELNRQLQLKQSEQQRIQETQQQLQNDLHERKEARLSFEAQRKEYDAAIEAQSNLREREKLLVDEIATLTNAEPQLEQEVRAKVGELKAHRDKATARLRQSRQEEQQCKQDLLSLQEKWRKVESQAGQKLDKELKRLGEQIAQTRQSQISAAQALEAISPQIASATETLSQKETFKRQILDNLDLRRLRRELESIRAEMENSKYKISALPSLEDVSRRVRAANATVGISKEERATLRGRQQQLEVQIREEKIKLRGAEYRNIEEKHRQKLIQHETTLMAVSDLDKYYKALDKSLLQYHSKKVEEINSIIKSLWQITYKGQDIDTIELVSGQDVNTGGTKAARSYDYRVVMKKGGALIDMRGRCSAGQKVLAALVIRLALAETFCLNCGILALDEPTTNLDTENKYGLAQAITDILNARSAQQNFQLVCITHDEEFVQMLSEAQSMDGSRPEYYCGNNRFCSKIERREWRDGV